MQPRTISAMFLLCGLTFAAQLFSLAYGRIDPQQSFNDIVFPSLFFLSLLTLPSCWFGVVIGSKLGLGAPELINILQKQAGAWKNIWFRIRWILPTAVIIGISLLVLREVTEPFLPAEIKPYGFRGVLGGFAVSVGAAVAEEVWFRLGLMTFLIWCVTKANKGKQPKDTLIWSIIVLSAVVFAAAHIPQLVSYGAASPFAIGGTMFGNTLVGVFFGWSYWRKGIMAAIIGHLTVDIVLHLVPAMF